MFFRKTKQIKELIKAKNDLQDKLMQAQRNQSSVQQTANHYRELYIELEKNRPRTLEEQLVEARRVQKELMDKRILAVILEANAQALQEDK